MEELITQQAVQAAADAVRERLGGDGTRWSTALVLGSGLGGLVGAVEDAVFVDYADVPGMPQSTAAMHEGRFVFGTWAGRPVACMQGRLHAYEGYTAQQIAFPIYVLHNLGVTELVVTNAAGGINESFEVGDLMLIEDQINFQLMNACIGAERTGLHPRFFDMTHAYVPSLREEARAAAEQVGLQLRSGVYIGDLGPSFETPAEIRAFRALGADAVGMSTVQEVIAANALGMKVLGISMISNPAAGVLDEPLSMDDVSRAAVLAADNALELLTKLFENRACGESA